MVERSAPSAAREVRIHGTVLNAGPPLVYVNGRLLRPEDVHLEPDSDEIISIRVLRGSQAVAKYGPGARAGVIDILARTSEPLVH